MIEKHNPISFHDLFFVALLAVIPGFSAAIAQGQTPDRARIFQRIVAESTTDQPLICVEDTGLPGFTPGAAGTCRINGTVNSGSGIGVALSFVVSGGVVTKVEVSRAGITFTYNQQVSAHSEISGPCFAAHYTVKAYFTDSTICTVTTTGSAPHSACTDAAILNSAAAVNAGSYSDLIAPGAITAIFGQNMANQTADAQSLPLPEQLAGVEVYVFFNTPLQKKARLFFASPGQVNALLPDDLPFGGLGTLAVINTVTDTLKPTWFYLNQRQPGVFTRSANGQGLAAGYFDQGHAVLFATGLNGATSAYLQIGNRQLPASFVGIAPGFAGLYQINIPDGQSVRGQFGVLCAGLCSQFFQVPQ